MFVDQASARETYELPLVNPLTTAHALHGGIGSQVRQFNHTLTLQHHHVKEKGEQKAEMENYQKLEKVGEGESPITASLHTCILPLTT